MRTLITIIAFLMLADGLFVLFNRNLVESWIKKMWPGLNIRKLAVAEVIIALLMLLSIYLRQVV